MSIDDEYPTMNLIIFVFDRKRKVIIMQTLKRKKIDDDKVVIETI